MDNKQDRQFYWEVKDFLGRNKTTPSSSTPKTVSLKESVSNILKSNDSLYTPKSNGMGLYEDFINSLDNNVVKSVNGLLDQHKKVLIEGDSGTAHSQNLTESLFTLNKKKLLNERIAQDLSTTSTPSGLTTKKQDEEEEEEFVPTGAQSQFIPPSQPVMATPPSTTMATKAPQAAPLKSSPSPYRIGSMGSIEGYDRDVVDSLRSARAMPKGDAAGRTPEERAANRAARAARNEALREKGIAATRERERLQDQAAEARRERDTAKKAITVDVEGPALPGSAQPSATEVGTPGAATYAEKQEKARQAQEELRKYNERTGYNRQVQFGNATQASIGAKYARKPGEVVSMPDNTVIQGTSMTYGEFKSQTGRDYNALNKDDSSLVSKLAGAGRYSSETARQTALSADQMNQMYSAQNAEMAKAYGEAERRMDRSQVELDRYRNDPAYREAQLKQEREAITNDPKFKTDMEIYKQQFEKNVQLGVQAKKQAAEAAREKEIRGRMNIAIQAAEEKTKAEEERIAKAYENLAKNSKPIGLSPETAPDIVTGPPENVADLRYQAAQVRKKEDDAYENEWRAALGMEPISDRERDVRTIVQQNYKDKMTSAPASNRNLNFGDYSRVRSTEVNKMLDNDILKSFVETGTLPGQSVRPSEESSPSLISSFTAKKPVSQSKYVEDQIKRLRGERLA